MYKNEWSLLLRCPWVGAVGNTPSRPSLACFSFFVLLNVPSSSWSGLFSFQNHLLSWLYCHFMWFPILNFSWIPAHISNHPLISMWKFLPVLESLFKGSSRGARLLLYSWWKNNPLFYRGRSSSLTEQVASGGMHLEWCLKKGTLT